MAKKKRSAPTKTCPECQASQHAATRTCKNCGHAFVATSPAKKATRTKTTKKAAATSQTPTEASIDVAINYVEAAGGVGKARKMLDKIEAIKRLK